MLSILLHIVLLLIHKIIITHTKTNVHIDIKIKMDDKDISKAANYCRIVEL